jgi:hypothetical protein
MNHEDFCELAALSALEILDETGSLLIEDSLVDFSDLASELAEFAQAVAALAYSAPPVAMAADLKQRLFQRIAEEKNPPIPTSISALKEQAANVSWEPYPIPGVMVGTLHLDSEKREIACFVRSVGNIRFPKHQHADFEEIVVLEGDLVIDGQVYESGERIFSSPNTVHQPETQGGCLLFLKTSLDDEVLI